MVIWHDLLELEVDKVLWIKRALFLLDDRAFCVVIQIPIASHPDYAYT